MMLVNLDPNVYAMAQQQSLLNSDSYGAKLMKKIKKSDDEIEEKYEGGITKKMSRRDWENCVLIGRLLFKINFNKNT